MSQATRLPILSRANMEAAPMHSRIFCGELFMVIATVFGLVLATPATTEAAIAGGLEDSVLLAWCLAGAVGAAACSVFMWPAKTQRESLGIFMGNSLFGGVFGPAVVNLACPYLQLPVTMANALAVAGAMSFVVSTGVRATGPVMLHRLVKWSETATISGIVLDAVLRALNIKPVDSAPPGEPKRPQ